MAISRLPAAANNIDVTVTVNRRLRPYFAVWYQRKKLDGETPEQFALRILKMAAMRDHLADQAKAEVDAVEATKETAMQALRDDAALIQTEVD